jgi:hypothetical protein
LIFGEGVDWGDGGPAAADVDYATDNYLVGKMWVKAEKHTRNEVRRRKLHSKRGEKMISSLETSKKQLHSAYWNLVCIFLAQSFFQSF